jgi:c(7)-type cytochrome triheme protein
MKQVLLFVATMLASAAIWWYVAPAVAVAQPLAFNHAKHTGALTCVACHSGVMTGAQATLPSGDICIKCHAAKPASVSQASWQAIQQTAGQPPAWVPVTRLPQHVMFSHRRHVALGGLACESCHKDIGTSTAPPTRTPLRLEMKTCLACHQKEGANEDCAGCHR